MYREHRLRESADFQRVRRSGRSVANRWLVLLHAPAPEGRLRFGISVSKKIGGAVARNRLKRQLRELIRLHLKSQRLRIGRDIVIIARTEARGATWDTLRGALDDLLTRAGLWKEGVPCEGS